MNRVTHNLGLYIAFPARLTKRLNYALTLIITVTTLAVILDGLALALLVPLIDLLLGTQDEVSSVTLIRWTAEFLDTFGVRATAGWMIGMIIVFQVLRAIGLALQIWLTTLFRAEYEEHLKNSLFRLLVNASWPHLTSLRSGGIINRVVAQSSRGGHTFSSYAGSVSAIMTALFYFIASLIISWELAIIAAAYAACLMFALSYFFVIGKRLGGRMTRASEDVLNEISESVGGLKTVKSSALEPSITQRFTAATARFARADSLLGLQQGLMQSVFELLFLTAMVAGLLFATRSLDLTNSAILLFSLLFFRIFQRARAIQSGLQSFYQLVPSIEAIEEVRKDAYAHRERRSGRHVGMLQSGVQLKNVSYEYVEARPVLRGVSVDIPAKKSVALVGPSGVGKTTIVDIVVGLINPSSGDVEIDGTPLSEIALDSWRGRIAYVPQGAILFHDTVARNIALGLEDAGEEDIANAATKAGAHEFIENLSKGYETVVGERGVTLSGGQRQRIALARALLRKPDLLILDEATSELDIASERRFQQTLDELHGSTAMLIVAHRFSTVLGADHVYVMDDGRVAESGSPEELIAQKGRFYTMIEQSGQVRI